MIDLPIEPLCQGRTNGCGTASLAMCLNYWSALNAEMRRFSQAGLDEGHRAWNSFCAPHMLLEIAGKHGFQGAIYQHAQWNDIEGHLQANRPMIVLHSVDGTITGLHYAVIKGIRNPGRSNSRCLILQDPATGQSSTIPFEEFAERFWQPLSWTGLHRIILVFSGTDNLPPSDALPWTLLGAYQINRLINTLARCLPIGSVHLPDLLCGLIQRDMHRKVSGNVKIAQEKH